MKTNNFISTAILIIFISGCQKVPEESEKVVKTVEKGDPVTAMGYVDLEPPVSYSPVRGVICESLGHENGVSTGACYDTNGPSVSYTQFYISEDAARTLKTKLESHGHSNKESFTTELGLICEPSKKACRFASADAGADASRHTKALYGFPGPPTPPMIAPVVPAPPAPPQTTAKQWPNVPAVSAQHYTLLDANDVGFEATAPLDALVDRMNAAFGSNEVAEGNYTQETVVHTDQEKGVIIFTSNGIPDDSVSGNQYVVEVTLTPEEIATITAMGSRQKCSRGENPDQWTNALCP